MSKPLSIGVDFGSTGVRVAYAMDGGPPVVLPDGAIGRWPWLFCEPASGRLGVAFPSLKSKLGADAAADLATEVFRAVKQAVESQTGRPVSQAVVSVPARYSSPQRAALRDALLAARFADVHLVSDTVSAVMAATAQRDTAATVLVYGMGYAGFEIGLVRAVRGHCRAFGYEGGRVPAGWALDQLLLQAFLEIASEGELALDVAHWELPMWMQVRAVAQQVKEDLSTRSQVTIPLSIQSPEGKRLSGYILRRSELEAAIEPIFAATLKSSRSLLEQADLTMDHVDLFLHAGGSTRIPLVQRLLEKEMGREPSPVHPDDLARGAALFAAQLDSKPFTAVQEVELGVDGDGVGGDLPGFSGLRAAIEAAEAGAAQPAGGHLVLLAGEKPMESVDSQAVLRHARRLAEKGRVEEARAALAGWIREAQALLDSLPAAVIERSASRREAAARRALIRARQLLEKGQPEEAVRESHYAWQQDRDNPDIFEKMIEVHCEAALASPSPDTYADAQRWLLCAYQHDESNGRVRELIADRHYLQARHLSDRGRRKEALQTLEVCLAWEPDHNQGRELQSALRRRVP